MFEAWLFVLADRARLPDTVDVVLYDLFGIFADICARGSAVGCRHCISGAGGSGCCRLWWQMLGKMEVFKVTPRIKNLP